MGESKKIIDRMRKSQNVDLGTTGAGICENKVYNLDDAKLLLFYLLHDIGIELGVKFDKNALAKEIWGQSSRN